MGFTVVRNAPRGKSKVTSATVTFYLAENNNNCNNWDSAACAVLFESALVEVQTQSYSGKILSSIIS